jgi:hypothetical protein
MLFRMGCLVALLAACCGRGAAVDQILVSDDFDSYAVGTLTTSPGGGFAGGLGWAAGQGWFVTDAVNGGGSMVIKDITAAGLTTGGKNLSTSSANRGMVGRVMISRAPSAGQPLWIGCWFIAQGVQAAYQTNLADTGNVIAFRKTDFTNGSNEVVSLNTGGTPFVDLSGTYLRWRLGSVDLADPAVAKVDDNPHFAVFKVETTQVSAWLFATVPASAPDSGAAMAVATLSSPQIDRIYLQTAGDGGLLRFDGLKIGTSWTAISDPTMPTIAAVSPTSGPTVAALPATTVTVTGSNFTAGAVVAVDGVAVATGFTDATTLTAAPPVPHAAGAVDVQVTIGTKVAVLPAAFAYAAPTTAVPALLAPPSISGVAQPGSTLTADPGTWQPAPASFTYQWQRADDTAGTNATALGPAAATATYAVVQADLGKSINVVVTAGGSSPAKSAASAYVPVTMTKTAASSFSGAVGPSKCGLGAAAALALTMLAAGLYRRRLD